MIRVIVPATTANVGPGFDSLGIALSLYDSFEVEESDGLFIEGCESAFSGGDNLFVRAYKRGLEELGLPFRGLRLRFDARIPIARGLGSSAACIVGGLMAANALGSGGHAVPTPTAALHSGSNHPLEAAPKLTESINDASDRTEFAHVGSQRTKSTATVSEYVSPSNGLDRGRILDLAAELEGHPDNVSPALLGGFTVSVLDRGHVRAVRCEVDGSLAFNALVPPFRLETEKARAILPKTLSLTDAVFNIGRAALVAAAFSNRDYEAVGLACSDRIHEPYRSGLIPGYDAVSSAAREAGAIALWLSGAGPTIMALTLGNTGDFITRIAPALSGRSEGPWHLLSLSVDARGARIEQV
jgi:homoserine kinase